MLIQELDVERFGRFIIAIVNPVGRVLDQGPKIIVKVKHQKAKPLFLEALRQLYRGGGLARGAWSADPHHPKIVPGIEPAQDFRRSLIQRLFVNGQ